MNRVFRTIHNEVIPDIVSHTLEVLTECPYAEVHIVILTQLKLPLSSCK